MLGPILGAVGLSFVTAELSSSSPTQWALFLGLLFVAVVVFIPDGVAARRSCACSGVCSTSTVPRAAGSSWPCNGRRRNSGLPASRSRRCRRSSSATGRCSVLRGVDFEILAGELLCIVGPNGAGKSTLLNVLTNGKVPMRGRIDYHLQHGRLAQSGASIHRIARGGVARKFQIPHLFDSAHRRGDDPRRLDARGAAVGVEAHPGRPGGSVGARDRRCDRARRPRERSRRALAHGLKQGLELAAALAMRPEILLLDEPTAGLTANERHVIGEVFRRLLDAGMTIVLIEHDLDFVARVADRVIVLHGGKVVESGTPAEVAASPVVREAYVGTAVT